MGKKVRYFCCGNVGKWDDYNPIKVTREEIVSETVYILNREPLTISQISDAIKKDEATVKKIIDSLLKANVIREDDGKYWINFTLYSKEDNKILLDIGKEYGKQLAHKLMENKTELSNLTDRIRCADFIERNKINFALIGCFALDWYCLEELEKYNFLVLYKKQPGNRDYILKGNELSDTNVIKSLLYCGSNNQAVGEYIFTSFGGGAVRSSFPNILWQVSTSAFDNIKGSSDLREAFVNVLSLYTEDLLKDCGKLIESLIVGKETEATNRDALLNLLEKLEYIIKEDGHHKVNIPVFFPEDKEIINKINSRVAKIVIDFIDPIYSKIRDALSGIRPTLNKIPFGETFSEVWHKIFGYCNRFLAEEGFMYDPPETPYNARYLPWITIER
ncbi:MAG: winged helix-turn-helix domain-containing protein [Candidatus Lokiarchaeia archaeon]